MTGVFQADAAAPGRPQLALVAVRAETWEQLHIAAARRGVTPALAVEGALERWIVGPDAAESARACNVSDMGKVCL